MILVIGDVMTDVIVRPLGAAAPGTDQRAEILRRPGGSGANIACWLGHAGIPVRFAGRVGAADLAAHAAAFADYGVQAHLAADPVRQTGLVVALLGAAGERSFFTDRGANLGLSTPDLPDSLLDGVRALHVSGHALFEAAPRDASRRLVAAARARGIAVSVDAGSAGWLAQANGQFVTWAEGATLCFANEAETAWLGGGFETLVVTRGAAGADLHGPGGPLTCPARPAAIIDGTGAGDAFAAGYLAATHNGDTPAAGLAQGIAWAAACLGVAGGRPGLTPAAAPAWTASLGTA